MVRLIGQHVRGAATACQTCYAGHAAASASFMRTLSMHASGLPRSRQHAASTHPASTMQRRNYWWSTATAASSMSPFSTSGSAHGWEHLDFVPQISPELLPLLLALLLVSKEEEDGTASPQEKPYSVKEVPSKGLGAFATADIPRGTIIISERALLIWPTKISLEEAQKMISNLTPSAQKAFYSLANIADPSLNLDPIFGIRATNGFNVELPSVPAKLTPATLTPNLSSKTASFIFPRIARINHSCAPNADHAMDWSGLKMTVYATAAIQPDQEICIEYSSGLVQKTRDERRHLLKRDFGFDCHCPVCAQEGEALVGSDRRRKEINSIVNALGEGKMPNKEAMWKTLERLETLLDQEGYKAMPEFTHQRVSDAYVGFRTIKQQHTA